MFRVLGFSVQGFRFIGLSVSGSGIRSTRLGASGLGIWGISLTFDEFADLGFRSLGHTGF